MDFIGNIIGFAIAFCIMVACLFGPMFLTLGLHNVWWLAAYPFTVGFIMALVGLKK